MTSLCGYSRRERSTKMRVISGGQSGADIAGLDAALACHLQTGGFMPKGFRTEDGVKPHYLRKYGIFELTSEDYPGRTRSNIEASQATIWFGRTNSPGGKLTSGLVTREKKAWLVVPYPSKQSIHTASRTIIEWLRVTKPGCLNVAGNRESHNRGIYEYTYCTLLLVFKEYMPDGR